MRGNARRRCWLVVLALGFAAAPAVANAQIADEESEELEEQPADSADKATPTPRAEGEYGGVTPGEGAASSKSRRAKRPVVTWVGFLDRADDQGGSQIFLQVTRRVEVDQVVADGKLYLTVAGARFGSANVRRRIDFRYFDTPVQEVNGRSVPRRRKATKRLPAGPAGALLVFDFKEGTAAAPAGVLGRSEDDGYYYVFLDFGPDAAGFAEPVAEAPAPAADAP